MSNLTDVTRKLVAVFAADVEGYSRLMGSDEVGTLKGLTERRAILDRLIGEHRGRIANTAGDSVLAEFASAVDAVQCAVDAQVALAVVNSSIPVDRRINFRMGIHIGDVMVRAGDLFGDGVNIAARLQTLAKPGGLCISGATYDQVRKVLPITFADLGPQQVKNIQEPIRAYQVLEANGPAPTAFVDAQDILPLPDKPSIAVLPFQNMSGDPEQEYFADGIVEDIITALSRFKSLFVIARNTSFTYKGKPVNVQNVGRELGVRYVLEGSVRKAADRLRITGQLIEAVTNNHLWAEKFDGRLEDVFELQDKVVSNVVGSIAPTLELAEIERANRKPTEKLDCYDLYLRGLSIVRSLRSAREARELFARAIERDNKFGPAYAMMAWSILIEQSVTGRPLSQEKRAQAIQLSRTAVQLASDDAFSLARAGHVLTYVGKEFDLGAAMIEEALTRNPNLASAWYSQGWVAMMCGDAAKAVESFETLLRLSPLDPLRGGVWNGMAFALFLLGRYAEGRARAERAKQLYTDVHSLSAMAVNCVGLGQTDEAKSNVRELLKLSPQFTIARAMEAFPTKSTEYRMTLIAAFEKVGLPPGE